MSATPQVATNVHFKNLHPKTDDCEDEVLSGLAMRPKTINPKYFYDTRGSELFERITQTPEYYPTRTERALLKTHAAEIAEYCGQACVLLEPGSGSSEKVRLLLPDLQPRAYVPMDIAAEFLHRCALELAAEFPCLTVHAMCADFARFLPRVGDLPEGRRVVFYPGSTLGNMHPEEARVFLKRVRQWVGENGALIIGIDLHKSTEVLNAAYNDAEGVTAAFNLNVLTHLNRLVAANFDPALYAHKAFYNESRRRIEMHLESQIAHIVRLGTHTVAIDEGECIQTENSYKYTLESFAHLAEGAGLQSKQIWLDEQGWYSLHYMECI